MAVILKVDVVIRLLCRLKSVLVIREPTTIEEGQHDFDNRLTRAVDMSFDLDDLALWH